MGLFDFKKQKAKRQGAAAVETVHQRQWSRQNRKRHKLA